MLKKNKKGFYELEEFGRFKGLIHGISTRKFTGEKLLAALGLKEENLVLMKQVHGNKIKIVAEADKGKTISGVDGLITNQPGVILGVKTADCLPVIFYDPEAKIIGLCHAGWRGVLAKISQKLTDLMIKKGSLPGDILVAIGPHIGGCCYTVDKIRAQKFLAEFGKIESMVYTDEKGIHLELSVPVLTQLLQSGLRRKNIFIPLVCTSCQIKEFFSYRRDPKKNYGEILGVVSI